MNTLALKQYVKCNIKRSVVLNGQFGSGSLMCGQANKVRHYPRWDPRQFPGQHRISQLPSDAVPFRCYKTKIKELIGFLRNFVYEYICKEAHKLSAHTQCKVPSYI